MQEPYSLPEIQAHHESTIPFMSYEEYTEKFKDVFKFRREDGIIEIRMHSNDDVASWRPALTKGIGQILKIVNEDPENEVVILTGTGDRWLGGVNSDFQKSFIELEHEHHQEFCRFTYDDAYHLDVGMLHNIAFNLDIPLITAMNGWNTSHTEFAMASDIFICTPDCEFKDMHFFNSMVPGDGQLLVLQQLLGPRRSSYLAWTGAGIDAATALELGIVDEVVERDKLLDRAWELARMMMSKDRMVRRMTHMLTRKPWRDAVMNLDNHFTFEFWASTSKGSDNYAGHDRAYWQSKLPKYTNKYVPEEKEEETGEAQ